MGSVYHLIQGQKYRIIKEFRDFDHITHPVGETWVVKKVSFLPYDDGITLIVDKDGDEIWYRLQWREEQQQNILDNFTAYVESVKVEAE